MPGINPIASEYQVLWEALKHYESHLEQLAFNSHDESQQLQHDAKLLSIEGIKKSLRVGAKSDCDLDLE